MVLISIFLMNNDIDYLFTCLLCICISFFCETSIKILYPVFNWVVLLLSCNELFISFIYKTFMRWFVNISSQSGLSFSWEYSFFFLREVFIEIIVDSHLETSLGTGGCIFSSEAPIFIMSTFKRSLKTVERLF